MSLLGAPTHRAPIGLLTDGTAANVFAASWHQPNLSIGRYGLRRPVPSARHMTVKAPRIMKIMCFMV